MTSWREELDRLPAGLAGDDVRVAIAEQADPIAWPDGATFVDANLPAALAKLVRKAWHKELEGARIVHLFKSKLGGTDSCRVIARAQKAGGLLAHLAGVDFVLVYSFQAWVGLTLTQKLALLDHELSHCGRDPDEGWTTVPHDLAEFGTVVRRFGAWHEGIKVFQAQLELFAGVARARDRTPMPDTTDEGDEPVSLHALLLLVQHQVDPEVIASWSEDQRLVAAEWATATRNDDDAHTPAYPPFLEPFRVRAQHGPPARGLTLEDGVPSPHDDGDSAARKRGGRRKGRK